RTVASLAFNSSGSVLVVGENDLTNGFITLRDPSITLTGAVTQTIALTNKLIALTVLPDDSAIVSLTRNGAVSFWQVFGLERTFFVEPNPTCAAFTTDGNFLAAGFTNQTIQLASLHTSAVRSLHGHTNSILGLAFSYDGQMLASFAQDEL